MGNIIKRPFRTDNGTDWDKHYFETSADQVKFTKDGKETNLQTEVSELNSNLNLISSKLSKIIFMGTQLVRFAGFTNAPLIAVPTGKTYAAFATNGDWDAANVNILGTFFYQNAIHVRVDKAISADIRINCVVFDVTP